MGGINTGVHFFKNSDMLINPEGVMTVLGSKHTLGIVVFSVYMDRSIA